MKIKPSVNSPDNLEEDEEEYFLFFPGSGGGNDRSIGFLIKDNVNYRDIIKDIVCGSGHSMFNTVPLYYVDHNIKHYEPIGSY